MAFKKHHFSLLPWLTSYRLAWLSGDLSAGVTVGIMLIPQGMAYALIAGLPPVHGLYAAILPQLLYAIFGTSRQLSVGPAAMDSLLVASGISVMATEGTEAYLHLVIALTAFVGLFQLTMGVMRLGFVTNFLSKPVISGFTSAAAFIIGVNQLKHLLGIELVKSNRIHEVLLGIPSKIQTSHTSTLIIGLICIVSIFALSKWNKVIPGGLIAVVFGILTVYFGELHLSGVSIIGEIPQGFPSFDFPALSLALFVEMMPLALTLAVISYVESYSVAKSMESKTNDHRVLPNQELVALGMSNIGGALFGALPIAGGFSRSSVNFGAGAKTPLASIISASFVALILIFFTSWFYYLPHAVLGAIIITAIINLIDFKYAFSLLIQNKREFLLLLITFLATLFFSLVIGIVSGVVASILYLIFKLAYPHIAQLGRLNGHHEFRNIKRFKDLETWDDIILLRIDAPFTFVNISYIKDYIETCVREREGLKTIILDAGSVSHIDASGSAGLSDLLMFLKGEGVELLMCDVIGPVRDSMSKTGLNEILQPENIFLDLNEAIKYATTRDQGDYKGYALQAN